MGKRQLKLAGSFGTQPGNYRLPGSTSNLDIANGAGHQKLASNLGKMSPAQPHISAGWLSISLRISSSGRRRFLRHALIQLPLLFAFVWSARSILLEQEGDFQTMVNYRLTSLSKDWSRSWLQAGLDPSPLGRLELHLQERPLLFSGSIPLARLP